MVIRQCTNIIVLFFVFPSFEAFCLMSPSVIPRVEGATIIVISGASGKYSLSGTT